MFLRSFIIGLAIIAAVMPLPPRVVERNYSTDLYPNIQRILTPISNMTPFALLDLMVALAGFGLLMVFMKRRGPDGCARSAGPSGTRLPQQQSCIWSFLVTWGLNYRRQPLEAKLDFDPARVSAEAVGAFDSRVVTELNRLAPMAHFRAWPTLAELKPAMEAAAGRAQRAAGVTHLPVPSRPQVHHIDLVFRQA